jgi:hypothetical protein
MSVSRRHFLSTASLLTAGAALTPLEAFSATVRPRIYKKQVPLTDTDQAVIDWVKTFATQVRLKGVSVLGKIRQTKRHRTHILAEVPTADDLNAALTGVLPFNVTLYASGDTITFTLDGTEFTIDAVLPADFQARLDSLLTRLGVTFAADGITWNPDTLDLTDPFGATVTDVLKLIFPGTGLSALFDTLLEGLSQADEANLGLGASFKGFRHRVMNIAGRRSAASAEIAQKFVGALPDLTENLTVNGLIALLTSPLIAGVLGKELGVQVGQIIAEFKLLRLLNDVDISDAAVFLSSLLQNAIDLGTADSFGASLSVLKRQRFKRALAQARRVTRMGI